MAGIRVLYVAAAKQALCDRHHVPVDLPIWVLELDRGMAIAREQLRGSLCRGWVLPSAA